ncbi:MAG: hypothetical protein RIR00_959 [Pseudomonadota bacterium]|jgi:uncharacterized membrane protein
MPDSSAFPLPPAAFKGDSRPVEMGLVFDWLRQGWAMFTAHPGVWMAATLIFMVVELGVNIVPGFGFMASHLLLPVFFAGMSHACQRVSRGEEPHVNDLFHGFQRQSATALLEVGLVFLGGVLAIVLLVLLLFLLVPGLKQGLAMLIGGMLTALLVFVLSVPLLMALWFAPILVSQHGMKPMAACRASFAACSKNLLPMGVFGLMLFILGFFALLSLALGMIVLLPVLAGAHYASYRDIFVGS